MSLCKHRNELTLFLTLMSVSTGVMSSLGHSSTKGSTSRTSWRSSTSVRPSLFRHHVNYMTALDADEKGEVMDDKEYRSTSFTGHTPCVCVLVFKHHRAPLFAKRWRGLWGISGSLRSLDCGTLIFDAFFVRVFGCQLCRVSVGLQVDFRYLSVYWFFIGLLTMNPA